MLLMIMMLVMALVTGTIVIHIVLLVTMMEMVVRTWMIIKLRADGVGDSNYYEGDDNDLSMVVMRLRVCMVYTITNIKIRSMPCMKQPVQGT